MKNLKLLCLLSLALISAQLYSQGYLHASGKQIVDGNGQNVILKSVNLGGWMVQEGYLLEMPAFGPQWKIRENIVDVIGEANTQEFYNAWLNNMVTEADVIAIKEWGFNSIRLPMHYNLFTYTIQEEPIPFESTWKQQGFQLVDQLLQWCSQHQIYLILDLHAAPGGQGEDQAISDYNPSLPSLWEDGENRSKTVHLWRKLASRYANEPWIGGYDILNETNWELGDNNEMLAELYESILWELRQVDNNHIVFIEGNWWANDFRGLTPPMDNNMAYSFHKYWNGVDQSSIQDFIDMRNQHNVPLWCGESGENSNQWYAETYNLLERNNIGYSFWPMKKLNQIQGLMNISYSDGLSEIMSYWHGEGPKPSVNDAKNALMQLAINTRFENCSPNLSVIDATTRMINTDETIPYTNTSIPRDQITAVNYDMGKNGFAYYDKGAIGHYGGDYPTWNNGWQFRNDAVDVYKRWDANEFYIGGTEDGEWLNYTVNVTQSGSFDLQVNASTMSNSATYHLEVNGADISGPITATNTGGWEDWATQITPNMKLNAGDQTIRLVIDQGGLNIRWLKFSSANTPVENIILTETTKTINVNEAFTLEATVAPDNASNKKLNWQTSNAAVATVNNLGIVTGIAMGQTIITATSESNPEISAQCTVNVYDIQKPKYTLTTTTIGQGSIELSPASGIYSENAKVELVAKADAGYAFKNWSGDLSGTELSTSILMNENKEVSAIFEKLEGGCDNETPIDINYSFTGSGEHCFVTSGTLSSINSWGLDKLEVNGQDITNLYTTSVPTAPDGKIHIQFEATLDWGHIEIAGEGGSNKFYELTTSINGQGSVTPEIGTFAENTEVTLTATPANGYVFDSWGGDASGSTTSINIVMNSDKNVSANFITIGDNVTLTTNVVGEGSISPSNGTYSKNETITLIATPMSGYEFDFWSGDVSGSVASIDLVMNTNKSATANFKKSEGGNCDNPISKTVPFSQEGSDAYCIVTTDDISYINSWNMEIVEINGIDFTNVWTNNLPVKQNGKYYIYCKGEVSWAHIEVNGSSQKSAAEINTTNTELRIYPNPATDILFIEMPEQEGQTEISIYNTQGKKVVQQQVSGNTTIDLSKLNTGIYTIKTNNSIKHFLKE